jgi:DNA repair protein RecN (Recombination protein N)
MLRFLRVCNFALIREIQMEFGPALNLLTGETGSGKSILVDALGVLLGGRASPEMVRSNCDAAILEGAFSLDCSEGISDLLESSGIRHNEDSLIVRREISSSGRSRAFINDSLATLSLLRTLGEMLADIHGQKDRETLLDLDAHVAWLDRFGGNADTVADVRERFRGLRELVARFDSMKMDEQERLRRLDILRFQLEEIRRANPQPQEREALEQESNILAHREKILALATEAFGLLHEHEFSLLGQLQRIHRILQDLEAYDSKWSVHREVMNEYLYRLEDLACALRDYASGMDFSPERLNRVEDRLADLDRLIKKYGNSIPEVLTYAERCQGELDLLLSHSEASRQLSEEIDAQLKEYLQKAEDLSEKRRKDGARLRRALHNEFKALAMEKMDLSVRFHAREQETRSTRIPVFCRPNGIDHLEFLIAPNKGEEFKPLAKIASGGELSRVMLAIRSLCGGGDAKKTLVVDEVDAGIGGRVAEAVGRRLRSIARVHQVLCVTHLPQIAAFACRHFRIHKDVVGSRTETFAKQLPEDERVEELARMLGGEIITNTARQHARDLLARFLEAGS